MFNALLLEYKCLWGLIRSVICDTECNITAVAITWPASVWDWDKMPARISCTRQFECDGVSEFVQIYWIFNSKWAKKTLKLIKHHKLFSYRAVFMTSAFCGNVPSIRTEWHRFAHLSVGHVVIMNLHRPAKKAERGPVTLHRKWLCCCLYFPVVLTVIFSLFFPFASLYYSMIYICCALGRKCLSETREWSSFGVHNPVCALYYMCGSGSKRLKRMQISALLIVCIFWTL